MNLILILVGAAALIVVASYIWLVVLAFQRSAVWGFATLLLVGAPAFVIVGWEEARRPFLWVLVAVLLVGAAWFSDPRNRLALNSSSGREMVPPRLLFHELSDEVKRKLAHAPEPETAAGPGAATPASARGTTDTARSPS